MSRRRSSSRFADTFDFSDKSLPADFNKLETSSKLLNSSAEAIEKSNTSYVLRSSVETSNLLTPNWARRLRSSSIPLNQSLSKTIRSTHSKLSNTDIEDKSLHGIERKLKKPNRKRLVLTQPSSDSDDDSFDRILTGEINKSNNEKDSSQPSTSQVVSQDKVDSSSDTDHFAEEVQQKFLRKTRKRLLSRSNIASESDEEVDTSKNEESQTVERLSNQNRRSSQKNASLSSSSTTEEIVRHKEAPAIHKNRSHIVNQDELENLNESQLNNTSKLSRNQSRHSKTNNTLKDINPENNSKKLQSSNSSSTTLLSERNNRTEALNVSSGELEANESIKSKTNKSQVSVKDNKSASKVNLSEINDSQNSKIKSLIETEFNDDVIDAIFSRSKLELNKNKSKSRTSVEEPNRFVSFLERLNESAKLSAKNLTKGQSEEEFSLSIVSDDNTANDVETDENVITSKTRQSKTAASKSLSHSLSQLQQNKSSDSSSLTILSDDIEIDVVGIDDEDQSLSQSNLFSKQVGQSASQRLQQSQHSNLEHSSLSIVEDETTEMNEASEDANVSKGNRSKRTAAEISNVSRNQQKDTSKEKTFQEETQSDSELSLINDDDDDKSEAIEDESVISKKSLKEQSKLHEDSVLSKSTGSRNKVKDKTLSRSRQSKSSTLSVSNVHENPEDMNVEENRRSSNELSRRSSRRVSQKLVSTESSQHMTNRSAIEMEEDEENGEISEVEDRRKSNELSKRSSRRFSQKLSSTESSQFTANGSIEETEEVEDRRKSNELSKRTSKRLSQKLSSTESSQSTNNENIGDMEEVEDRRKSNELSKRTSKRLSQKLSSTESSQSTNNENIGDMEEVEDRRKSNEFSKRTSKRLSQKLPSTELSQLKVNENTEDTEENRRKSNESNKRTSKRSSQKLPSTKSPESIAYESTEEMEEAEDRRKSNESSRRTSKRLSQSNRQIPEGNSTLSKSTINRSEEVSKSSKRKESRKLDSRQKSLFMTDESEEEMGENEDQRKSIESSRKISKRLSKKLNFAESSQSMANESAEKVDEDEEQRVRNESSWKRSRRFSEKFNFTPSVSNENVEEMDEGEDETESNESNEKISKKLSQIPEDSSPEDEERLDEDQEDEENEEMSTSHNATNKKSHQDQIEDVRESNQSDKEKRIKRLTHKTLLQETHEKDSSQHSLKRTAEMIEDDDDGTNNDLGKKFKSLSERFQHILQPSRSRFIVNETLHSTNKDANHNESSQSNLENETHESSSKNASQHLHSQRSKFKMLTKPVQMETVISTQTQTILPPSELGLKYKSLQDFDAKHGPLEKMSKEIRELRIQLLKDPYIMQETKRIQKAEWNEIWKRREEADKKREARALKRKLDEEKEKKRQLQEERKRRKEEREAQIPEAFKVNGKVYKPPRLMRPKHWCTKRFYTYLQKKLEPKYGLDAKVQSEKLMMTLVHSVTFITKAKKYDDYKELLNKLKRELARKGIIVTHRDFTFFCRDYLPFEFRIKAVPMLLPGNVQTIPDFDPHREYLPILES